MEYTYEIDDPVTIKCSGEEGVVVGIAHHKNQTYPQYLVRYKAADGRAVEVWWDSSALEQTG